MLFKTVGFEVDSDEEKQYYINEALKEVEAREAEFNINDIEHVIVTLVDTDDTVEIDVKVNNEIRFERIRRITGYLSGSLDTWNNAKKAEESERVKHI